MYSIILEIILVFEQDIFHSNKWNGMIAIQCFFCTKTKCFDIYTKDTGDVKYINHYDIYQIL